MKTYKFTDLNAFENEIAQISSNATQLIVEITGDNYKEVKEQILDSCYDVEDYDPSNNLIIVKWTPVELSPIRKMKQI